MHIIFDSYEILTTKGHVQKRHQLRSDENIPIAIKLHSWQTRKTNRIIFSYLPNFCLNFANALCCYSNENTYSDLIRIVEFIF